MRLCRAAGPLRIASASVWCFGIMVAVTLAACGEHGLADPVEVVERDSTGVITGLTLNDDSTMLTVLGSRVRFTVRARDSAGSVVCTNWAVGCASWLLTERFAWKMDVPEIVSLEQFDMGIYPNGGVYLTALAEGRVELTASLDSVEATAVVDVVERARVAWAVTTMGASVGIALGEDGTIYMAGSVGLQAVSPEGAVLWSHPASVKAIPAIAEDGTIYLGTGGGEGLKAIDPSGNLLWVTEIDRIWSPPVIGPNGTIYQGTSDGSLYAVDPAGQIEWQFDAPPSGALFRNRSPPAIAEDGTIYFGSEDHHLYALEPDGSERWRFGTDGPARAPSIGVDGTIYFANDRIAEWSNDAGRIVHVDSRMFALNPDGTERWSAPMEGDVWTGPAIGFDGSIYMATINGGDLYVFTPDGSLLRTLGGGAIHTPIVGADGSVYRSSGVVTAVDGEGTPRWAFQPENFAGPVPAIGFDGRIYAGASDSDHVSTLYGFEELDGSHGDYHSSPWPQERGDRANTGRARAAPGGR